MKQLHFMVTGGAGFIGSAFIRLLISKTKHRVLNVDKITYAGNLTSLDPVSAHPRYRFVNVDICDRSKLDNIIAEYKPDVVVNLAAETHVDRSIDGPRAFITTNVVGTFELLEACRSYWQGLSTEKKKTFLFQHVSTDEVFGDLTRAEQPFTERSPYQPNSPYAASKAASDHLVRSWGTTYSFPFIITNCSNNYGPYQFPEKFIPKAIVNAITGKPIPIYGDGRQIRDWLFVNDHANALLAVATKGQVGETYLIGSNFEIENIELANIICERLDTLIQDKPNNLSSFKGLITTTSDRPGHDKRYALNPNKISTELNWRPLVDFDRGISQTINWYMENIEWWQSMVNFGNATNRYGLLEKG